MAYFPPRKSISSDIDEQRVQFDQKEGLAAYEHRNMVWRNPTRTLWEKAMCCPCGAFLEVEGKQGVVPASNQDCECRGSGILYYHPEEIAVMSQNASDGRDVAALYAEFGKAARGMQSMTILPENLPNILDRYTFLDGEALFDERRQRKGTTTRMRYPIIARKTMVGVPPSYTEGVEQVNDVVYCRRCTPKGKIISGELVSGVDFDIVNMEIDWSRGIALGTAPEEGAYFSMVYNTRPVYVNLHYGFSRRAMFFLDPDTGDQQYGCHPLLVLGAREHLGNMSSPQVAWQGYPVTELAAG